MCSRVVSRSQSSWRPDRRGGVRRDRIGDRHDEEGSITVLDSETGESLITIAAQEFERVRDEAYTASGQEYDSANAVPTPALWLSSDGQMWTSVDVEETFGSDRLPSEVSVEGVAVILRWPGLASETADGELDDVPDEIWVGHRPQGG